MSLSQKYDVTLTEVLSRVATELRHAANISSNLQNSLSPHFTAGKIDEVAGQNLDLLTQILEGLTGFTAALSDICHQNGCVSLANAAEGLRLQNQRRRLCLPSSQENELYETGLVELF